MAGLQHGQLWGDWVLDADEFVLRHSCADVEIALEDMVNSAYVLDWIVKVSMKPWASVEDVGNLVRALDEIFELRSNICKDSCDRRLNAREHLLAVLPDGLVVSTANALKQGLVIAPRTPDDVSL